MYRLPPNLGGNPYGGVGGNPYGGGGGPGAPGAPLLHGTNNQRLAPLPQSIDQRNYNFGNHQPHRFTMSGALAPNDRAHRRINWNQVQIPRDRFGTPLYRFNDVHCHMHNYAGGGHRIADVVEAAYKLGVGRFTLTPIPTTLVSCRSDKERFERYGADCCPGQDYYIPRHKANITSLTAEDVKDFREESEVRVDASVDDNLKDQVAHALRNGEILPHHLDKMDLALTGIHLGSPRVTKDMLQTLWRMKETSDSVTRDLQRAGVNMGPHRLRFGLVGEVTLRKELIENLYAGRQADLKNNIAPTREAMRLAGVVGMPWVLHCDVDKPQGMGSGGEKGKAPVHFEDIKALMKSCPNTEIIWAHAGGLGRFVKESPDHIRLLTEMMNDPELSHVKLDISWSQVANQISRNPQALQQWANFLCQFQDRVLFGSDTLTPQTNEKWTETYDIYNQQRGLFQRMEAISPGSVNKLLFSNYDNVVVAARERIDVFTEHVLPKIIHGNQSFMGPDPLDVKSVQAERDMIYAQMANVDPRVQNVMDHFARRDQELPEVGPGKERKNQRLKEKMNAITGGLAFKNYEKGSGRSGDYVTNRQLQQRVHQLSTALDGIGDALAGVPGIPAPQLMEEYQRLRNIMDGTNARLNTTTRPTDEALRTLQADIGRLHNALVATHNVNLPPPLVPPRPPAPPGPPPGPAPLAPRVGVPGYVPGERY
jgi:hypothetical protein